MKTIYSAILALLLAATTLATSAQAPLKAPRLPHSDTILLTVFLKHDQTMNNVERGELLDKAGFNDLFPPEGVEVVNHYVVMGIGQVLVLRFAPDLLRAVNVALELGAWGAYQTEFYITYDLAEARRAAAQN